MKATARKVSPAQIQELFAFCKKKRIRFYELQLELVDHLATDIESQWASHPDRTFLAALDKAYGRFGIFGFARVEEAFTKKADKSVRPYIIKLLKPILFTKDYLYFILPGLLINVVAMFLLPLNPIILMPVNVIALSIIRFGDRKLFREKKAFQDFYIYRSMIDYYNLSDMSPCLVGIIAGVNFSTFSIFEFPNVGLAVATLVMFYIVPFTMHFFFGKRFLALIREDIMSQYPERFAE